MAEPLHHTLIKHFEDCTLTAYPDPASPLGLACTKRKLKLVDYQKVPNWNLLSGDPWTNGWGHTGKEIRAGHVYTQAQADGQFLVDIALHERVVASQLVNTSLLPQHVGACVSFGYNIGEGTYVGGVWKGGLGGSTLERLVNKGDLQGAALEFPKWNKAGGKVLLGLSRRRASEAWLFLHGELRYFEEME